jgi:YgiT-type zinc finger domain-containing protein
MKDKERCYFCHGGPVVKKRIDHVSKINGRFVEIKGVPCEVCEGCGEKYFEPETISHLQKIVKHKAENYIKLPVYSYA